HGYRDSAIFLEDERTPAGFECCERETLTARFGVPFVANESMNERAFAALRTATVSSGMARLIRSEGPDMPTDAITSPVGPKIGAAIPHTSSRHSPRLTENPALRISAACRHSSLAPTWVAAVRRCALRPISATSRSSRQARIALPVALA